MSKKNQEAPPPVDGSFLRALQEHRQGMTLTELSEKMRQVVEAAHNCGKTAKLTLEVTVSPNGNAVAFTAEVKTKIPTEKPYAGVFFMDDHFNLFRNDPKNPEIAGLRTVAAEDEQQPLRKAVGE